jgi:hypothetical protein
MMRWMPLLLVVAAACAGKPIASSFVSPATAPQPDVFACLRKQIAAEGWSQESYDTGEYRVTARKYDLEARRPDVQFRRVIHRLTFDVNPGSEDQITTVRVEAATYAEYTTQRGPTEILERTAGATLDAGRRMSQTCAAGAPETS